MTAAAMKTGVYAQRLLENEYVQGNLGRAAENLKAAYKRASKRRVSPAGDEKVLGQLRGAVLLIAEAASALKADRQKPKPRWGRRAVVVLALGVGGAAAVLAANDELRSKVLGGDPDLAQGSARRTP